MATATYTAGYMGALYKDDANWSNVYTATTADGGGIIASGTDEWCSARYSGGYPDTSHFFISINTSAIADTLTIEKASLFVYSGGTTNADSWNVGLYKGTQPDTTLATSHFASYTTLYDTKSIASLAGGGWKEFVLNTTAIADINKTGYTKYVLLIKEGRASTAPTGSNSIYTSVTNAPYLVISWGLSKGNPMFFSSGGLTLG